MVNRLPADRLRHPSEESADTVWAAASTEALLLWHNVLGWTWPQIYSWLARTLEELLLKPEE